MFPGQGCQYLGMGRELYATEAIFAAEVDRCAELLAPYLGDDLRRMIWPAPNAGVEPLTATWIVQPALFVIEYALARLWLSWGVRPAAMIGYSIGEYVALCLADVVSLADALTLVAARGRLMQDMPPGSMIAVDLPISALGDLAAHGLELAGANTAERCVLAGTSDAVAAFQRHLQAAGQPSRALHTSHAFHSAMMEPMLEPFTAMVAAIALRAPRIPVISNLTGTWLTAKQACAPDYYARQLRHTVRFADGVRTLLGNGEPLFLEVGPGRTLGTFVQQCSDAHDAKSVLGSMRHPQQDEPDQAIVLTSLGQLWLSGVAVDWAGVHAEQVRRRVPLPGYPFERQRHWVEPGTPVTQTAETSRVRPKTAPTRRALADWFYTPAWKPSPLPENATPARGPWLVFTTGEGLGEQLLNEFERNGLEVVGVLAGSKTGWSGVNRYTVNPALRSSYDALIDALAAVGKLPRNALHGWNLAPTQATSDTQSFALAQNMGFNSLLFLAQALGAKDYTEALRIGVLGTGIQTLTQSELPVPDRSTLIAACIVIAQEYSSLDPLCVDLALPAPGSSAEQELVRQILREMDSDAPQTIVAYREGRRWVPDYRPLRLAPAVGDSPRLRRQGVYLITGGLGNIGYVLAQQLARQAQARLILTGRSVLPDPGEWDGWIVAHGTDHPISERIARVRALEALGAEVMVVDGDVADREAMLRVLEKAHRRFGHIDGVIHGAGIVAEEAFVTVQDMQATNCAEHFQPKVHGLLTLHGLLRNDPPELYLLLSSISTLVGGLGYAAYAAANCYLDAYAARESRQSAGTRWLAIDWDAWSSAASRSERHGMGAIVTELAMSSEEGADAFRRILSSEAGDQVIVSTTDLYTRIGQWVRRKTRSTANTSDTVTAPAGAVYASEMQTVIAGIWQAVLGVDQIEPDDNFFDLGGDSLLLMNVISRLKANYGIVLNPREILFQTLAQLAAVCEKRKAAQANGEITAAAAGPVPIHQPARKSGLFGALKRTLGG